MSRSARNGLTTLLATASVIVALVVAGCGGTTSHSNPAPYGKSTGQTQTQAPRQAKASKTQTQAQAPGTTKATTPSSASPAPATSGIPQGNGGDQDADNNGGPSDGDGNI